MFPRAHLHRLARVNVGRSRGHRALPSGAAVVPGAAALVWPLAVAAVVHRPPRSPYALSSTGRWLSFGRAWRGAQANRNGGSGASGASISGLAPHAVESLVQAPFRALERLLRPPLPPPPPASQVQGYGHGRGQAHLDDNSHSNRACDTEDTGNNADADPSAPRGHRDEGHDDDPLLAGDTSPLWAGLVVVRRDRDGDGSEGAQRDDDAGAEQHDGGGGDAEWDALRRLVPVRVVWVPSAKAQDPPPLPEAQARHTHPNDDDGNHPGKDKAPRLHGEDNNHRPGDDNNHRFEEHAIPMSGEHVLLTSGEHAPNPRLPHAPHTLDALLAPRALRREAARLFLGWRARQWPFVVVTHVDGADSASGHWAGADSGAWGGAEGDAFDFGGGKGGKE
ncbi:hypothetical protein C8J57DRAFT_1706197 [Mycena rebaudengoi]|nr:hypothetical protein C8J57DRAFT_1706197 [Mycena rebaudengoi]